MMRLGKRLAPKKQKLLSKKAQVFPPSQPLQKPKKLKRYNNMALSRMQKKPITLTMNATNNTVGTGTLTLNGIIRGIKIKTPSTVDSSATIGVTIADAD